MTTSPPADGMGDDLGGTSRAVSERLARRALEAAPHPDDGLTVVVFSDSEDPETIARAIRLYDIVDVERPDAAFAALVCSWPDSAHRQIRVVGRGMPENGYGWEGDADAIELLAERDPVGVGVLDRILLHRNPPPPPSWTDWLGRLWLAMAAKEIEAPTAGTWATDPLNLVLSTSPIVVLGELCQADVNAPRPLKPTNSALRQWLFDRDWAWAHHQLAAGAAPEIVPADWAQWAGRPLTAWVLADPTPSWARSAARLVEAGLDVVVETISASLAILGAR